MANTLNFLHDIEVRGGRAAYATALNSPVLESLLYAKASEVVRLYQAKVGKKTGNLAASADASTPVGGHNKDRIVGKVTVANENVYARTDSGAPDLWNGEKFYYGEYHEEGTKKKGRRRRRKTGQEGYHELREVAQEWRSI